MRAAGAFFAGFGGPFSAPPLQQNRIPPLPPRLRTREGLPGPQLADANWAPSPILPASPNPPSVQLAGNSAIFLHTLL